MEPANLLILMSDQHTRAAIGAYGSRVAKTPNLDRLAAEGTRFSNAYSNSPICVPARASFATGRYPHDTRCWDNATPYSGREAPSWGHRLTAQDVGVTTIGKLHFRSADAPTGFDDQRLPMHVADGIGDLRGLLRGEMPPKSGNRRHLLEAGAGESEYVSYDRAVADAASRWLHHEAPKAQGPWTLFTSFVSPHPPLVAPRDFLDLYDEDTIPLPTRYREQDWPQHPSLQTRRRLQALDEPVDESTLRAGLAAYYALVSFLDDRVGQVLSALEDAGLSESTRVVYLSDHGEMLGAHGLWWKSVMYEGSLGIPLIARGPDVPPGGLVSTPVSMIDGFPSIVEATGARLQASDEDLPGTSWWRIMDGAEPHRHVFAEYHAAYSGAGIFALRQGAYKYVHYEDGPLQLFDLVADPDELEDLAADPDHGHVVTRLHERLLSVVDPGEAEARAREDQQRLLEQYGGREQVLRGASELAHTPVPDSSSLED